MKAGNNTFFVRYFLSVILFLVALSCNAVELISNLIRCAEGMTPYVVLNGEERTSGKFYGYKNGGTGPGAFAFKDAKAWADAHNTPLVVVFDNGSGNSNTFTADLNDDEDYQGGRYLLQWMNGKAGPDNFNCMFTYFKGSTTAPEACKDAYEFCKLYGAGSFPVVVCYWKWPDGTIRTSVTGGLSSVGSFEGPVNSFLTKNKPPPTPPYVPPKASAGFAVKDGELKVLPGAEQVYVPFVRTNNLNVAETNWMVSEFPGVVATNEFSWASNGESYKEVSLALGGRLTNVNDKVILVFLNTNQVAVASNSVTCAAIPANSATFPYLPGAVETLLPGEWSVDAGLIAASSNNVESLRNNECAAIAAYDNATNALAIATAAYDTATNALYLAGVTNETATAALDAATNALSNAVAAYDAATNTLYWAGVTNDTATTAYVDATNALVLATATYDAATNALHYAGVTNDTAAAAYVDATNALALAMEAYDVAATGLYCANETNELAEAAYVAATNGLAEAATVYDGAVTVLAAANVATNTTYDAYVDATNELVVAIATYDAATNALHYAGVTNDTAAAAYVDATNALAVATMAYIAASNALEAAASGTPEYDEALAAFIAATNTLYYADVTNNLATAAHAAAAAAFDSAYSAFSDASSDLTEAGVEVDTAYGKYVAATNKLVEAVLAYDAATNALYYAGVTNDTAVAVYIAATNALVLAAAAYDEATNTLYWAGVTNDTATAAYVAATNALANAILAYDGATNTLYWASVTNDMSTAAYVAATNELADAILAYDGATNTLYWAGVTNELAEAAYVVATNELTMAEVAVGDASDKLDAAQGVADEKTGDLDAATAAREEAESGLFLVVCGGILCDNALAALNRDVFSNEVFGNWCVGKRMAAIYVDVPEPGTGSSLFSYNVASNGSSGAMFVSLNGLDASECAVLASQASEAAKWLASTWGLDALPSGVIALVRADGSVCGCLCPQFNADGTCDLVENIKRLDELVAQAEDAAEAFNDTPVPADEWRAGLLPELAFDNVSKGWLSVNDTVDFVLLSGSGWGDGKFAFSVPERGAVVKAANLAVDLVRYDAKSGALVAIDGSMSIFATNGVRDVEYVYSVDQSEVDAGALFARVSAYEDEESATSVKFNGASTFAYTLAARPATPNGGVVSFLPHSEEPIIQAATNQVVQVPLCRLFGSDGDIGVTVTVDENLTTATNRYSFSEQVLVWTNGEESVKSVPITLLGSEFNDGMHDITLRIGEVAAMEGVEKYYTTYTISYGKEPSDEGQISVVSVAPAPMSDGRIYVRYTSDGELHTDDVIKLQANRTGGKGPAALNIGWKNGRESIRKTLSWANYLTGTQTEFLDSDFPAPGSSGYVDVTVNLTSSNSIPVVSPSLKVRVLPAESPLFADSQVVWSGVQYTSATTNLTTLVLVDGMTVKSLNKISGTVPAGLKVSVDSDGRLVVTGVPTSGTVSTKATFWATLSVDGGKLYSMPVTVTFENKALADVNEMFDKARSWTGLPLVCDNGKLAGLLDLTVPKNGKASARWRRSCGKTVAFSTAGISCVDPDGTARFVAEKSLCCGLKYAFNVALGKDGSLDATITETGSCDVDTVVGVVKIGSDACPWSVDNTAERFGGDYVAAFPLADPDKAITNNTLCFGATSMRLKCTTKSAWTRGVVTFAGTLPNGKAVSGTAYLVPTTNYASVASLPIFASSSSDTFAAMVDIDGASLVATDGITPYWGHNEANINELSYENELSVLGATWSWAEWLECFDGAFNANAAFGTSFNINRVSGVASGTMRLDVTGSGKLSTVQWKGVVLPCAEPRVVGAYWYNVSEPYGPGNERRRTVKAGKPVSMNVQ